VPDLQIERIYHQIETELSVFSNQLKKLEVPNYPIKRCQEIIEKLIEKVEAYKDKIKLILDQKDDNPDEAVRKLITQIHNPLVRQDVKFLDWLRGAQTQNVPWSFIPCIEHLAQAIIPRHELLTYCANDYNYGITWSQSASSAPYPYTVLSLPRLHRTNILWHTIIGHELFHPRCVDFIKEHNEEALTKIYTQCEKAFRSKENKGLSRKLKEEQLDRITETTHVAWCRAMVELLCDMACVELFGPAAILATRAFAACSPIEEMPSPENNFYPPRLFRFEVVWKYSMDKKKLVAIYTKCQKSEAIDCFKQEMESFAELVSSSEGAALLEKHPLAKIAYGEVNRFLYRANVFVKRTLPDTIERWHSPKVLGQIPKLLERLQKGVPPNELVVRINKSAGKEKYETQSAELSAILIAGWIYETYWQKKYDQDAEIMPYETISRLLLKACEDIQFNA